MIKEKQCNNKECGKTFYGTKRAKFCSDKCRVTNWRKSDERIHKERARTLPEDVVEPIPDA
jgi:hypothetical protein